MPPAMVLSLQKQPSSLQPQPLVNTSWPWLSRVLTSVVGRPKKLTNVENLQLWSETDVGSLAIHLKENNACDNRLVLQMAPKIPSIRT